VNNLTANAFGKEELDHKSLLGSSPSGRLTYFQGRVGDDRPKITHVDHPAESHWGGKWSDAFVFSNKQSGMTEIYSLGDVAGTELVAHSRYHKQLRRSLHLRSDIQSPLIPSLSVLSGPKKPGLQLHPTDLQTPSQFAGSQFSPTSTEFHSVILKASSPYIAHTLRPFQISDWYCLSIPNIGLTMIRWFQWTNPTEMSSR
jgi:hypothetical protein